MFACDNKKIVSVGEYKYVQCLCIWYLKNNTLRSLVCVVFDNFLLINATERRKIRSDQKRLFFTVSLYPLLFFANTTFKISIVQFTSVWRGSHLKPRIYPEFKDILQNQQATSNTLVEYCQWFPSNLYLCNNEENIFICVIMRKISLSV